MDIDEKELTKGQKRKLKALHKSVGVELGNSVFSQWLRRQNRERNERKPDPVIEKMKSALADLANDKTFRLGNTGYTVRRARGHGASGFVITQNQKSPNTQE